MRLDMLIAIEGLDGVGKTAVAHEVARATGGVYAPFVPRELRLVNDSFLETLDTPTRLLFFVGCVAQTSSMNHEGVIIVADRHLASVFAQHRLVNSNFLEWAKKVPLARPDITFLLVASETVRRDRLRVAKGRLDAFEARLESDNAFREAFELELRAWPGIRTILTEGRGIPSIAAEIASEVNAARERE